MLNWYPEIGWKELIPRFGIIRFEGYSNGPDEDECGYYDGYEIDVCWLWMRISIGIAKRETD